MTVPADDLPDDLIDLRTAAIIAKCNTECVFRWTQRGKIRGWRRVGRVFVSRAEVLALFKPLQPPAKKRKFDPAVERLKAKGML